MPRVPRSLIGGLVPRGSRGAAAVVPRFSHGARFVTPHFSNTPARNPNHNDYYHPTVFKAIASQNFYNYQNFKLLLTIFFGNAHAVTEYSRLSEDYIYLWERYLRLWHFVDVGF